MSELICEIKEDIARIVLNRPERLNAFDEKLANLWKETNQRIASDSSVKAVVLSGNGPSFCAGGDVKGMSQLPDGREVTRLARIIHEGTIALITSDKPVVAAVHGANAGGGLGIMLAADYVIADPKSRFAGKYSAIGLTPDLGVSTLVARVVGQTRAFKLLLKEDFIDVATALDWGLISEISDNPLEEAQKLATEWSKNAFAFGQAKRLVRAGFYRSQADSFSDEAETIGKSFDTDAAKMRIGAFIR